MRKNLPAGQWKDILGRALPKPAPYYAHGADHLSVTVDTADRQRLDILLDADDIDELIRAAEKAGLCPRWFVRLPQ